MTLVVAISLLSIAAHAQSTLPSPEVWMGPPGYDHGRCMRELFEHPEQWEQTRKSIDVLFYTDLNFNKQFTDAELTAWFAMMKQWGLRLGMEVGAIKPWGATGAKTFGNEQPMWERIERLGGKIDAIAMDEPLLCVRRDLKKDDAYAVQETANYIALVRKNFPDIRVGDIETYPSIPLEEHFPWIDALQKKLAEMNVRGLDFYRLDVNWVVYNAQGTGSWKEVRKLEQGCRKRKIPFSLIYWASGYPGLAKRGLADDSTWYTTIMQQGYDYAFIDGKPDQYVIESWLDDAPKSIVPETDQFSFTRSVLDFSRRFAHRGEQNQPAK